MLEESFAVRIDRLFKQWDKPDSPGCALGIIQDGKMIYKKGYGMANLEHNIPINPQTMFYIGSKSKQFTAMCILLLTEQNIISLDDKIRKHIPNFPDYGQTITIRNLIHHTSGIRCRGDLFVLSGKIMGFDRISIRDALKIIYNQKGLNFNPGEQFLYSISNYFLLATIIKNATGKSVREFAKEKIFKPLGMKNTHYQDNNWEIIKERAFCYVPDGKNGYFNAFVNHDGPSSGGGGVFTNIEDLFLWDQNFYNNKLGNSDPNLIKIMQTPATLKDGKKTNYACGLIVDKYKGQIRIWHPGGKAGYRAIRLSFPDQRLSIIVLCNYSNIDDQSLALQISDMFLENNPKSSNLDNNFEQTTISVDPKIYRNYIGYYISEPLGLVNISSENNNLMFKYSQLPRMELIPESKTSYFLKNFNLRITFDKDDNGKYSQITLHKQGDEPIFEFPQFGKDLISKKIETAKRPEGELKQYDGRYYNEEIDVTHRLLTEDSILYIYGESSYVIKFPMTFLKNDTFLTPFSSFSFQRTEGGIITGYRLDTAKVKNLWFKRT